MVISFLFKIPLRCLHPSKEFFCYHLLVKLQRSHFRWLISKIQLDYPKEFCQFFQGCKFGLAYSFLGHWSRICLFWRIALLLLTTFCGTLKTIFKVAITKNQNYAITAFLFTLSFFLSFFLSFLVLIKFSFLFFSGVILVPRLYAECNSILCLTPPPPPHHQHHKITRTLQLM